MVAQQVRRAIAHTDRTAQVPPFPWRVAHVETWCNEEAILCAIVATHTCQERQFFIYFQRVFCKHTRCPLVASHIQFVCLCMLSCSLIETIAYFQWRHPKFLFVRCHHLIIVVIIQAQTRSDFVLVGLIEICLEHRIQIEVALHAIIHAMTIHVMLIVVRTTCDDTDACAFSLIKHIALFHKRIHAPCADTNSICFIKIGNIVVDNVLHSLTANAFVIQATHEVLTCICTVFHIPAVQQIGLLTFRQIHKSVAICVVFHTLIFVVSQHASAPFFVDIPTACSVQFCAKRSAHHTVQRDRVLSLRF